ncbi:PRD domain-containing protein [Carnobacterium divergens]|uniref:BglG family transcription antiterminator n=1 Tax=Carnobacterium divergens TaxID=2748 RepID=UPI000D4BF567|nr:PRD domain-containing protein [Carnobacterium divergens]MCO6018740.1 PRD domain-containing protein [Carnobacterium divergens]SPC36415.1 PRD domain protein [Carnobacterium divergens]
MTERTVRNKVMLVNKAVEKPIIVSSKDGYLIDTTRYYRSTKETKAKEHFPETVKERQSFLMRALLTSAKAPLNLYDLAEELSVSEVTIKRDLKNIKTYFYNFEIELYSREDNYRLKGNELQKRKAMTYLLYEESKKTVNQEQLIQEILGDIDFNDVKKIVVGTLESYDYVVNHYSLATIYLHFAVALQRIKENKKIEPIKVDKEIKTLIEYTLTKEITRKIQATFQIDFSDAEIYHLSLLFVGNTTLANYQTMSVELLQEYIGVQTVAVVKEVLADIGEMYYIHLSDAEFTTKFMIHVRNLIDRSTLSKLSKNPLRDDLKRSYPLIYDISVSIASELEKRLEIQVNEDEIAYIALHLGSYLESIPDERADITCIVVCPKYYDIHQGILEKIKEHFSKELLIQEIVTDMSSNWQVLQPDLVISTILISDEGEGHVVYVHPFLTKKDLSHITEKIQEIHQERERKAMEGYIQKFFQAELFSTKKDFKTKEEVIRFMTQQLYHFNYVSQDFTEKVLAREALSSTAFSEGVAVPHALKMNAFKTGVAVTVLAHPIDWNGTKVSIVAIFAVNKDNRPIFSPLFEKFIQVLSEDDNIQQLKEVKLYSEFTKKLLQLMDSKKIV